MKIESKGLKDRKDKVRLELVYPNFIIGVGEVLTYGASKYKANSWQNVDEPFDTHYSALLRHLLAWRNGELIDKDSGLSHIKHVAANVMFLLYHEEKLLKNNNDINNNVLLEKMSAWSND